MASNQSLSELQRSALESQIAGTSSQPSSPPTMSSNSSATGILPAANIAALGAVATLVKGSKTRMHGYNLANPNASIVFVQLFNAATAGAVTLGTTVPSDWLAIPANGVIDGWWPNSPQFDAGLVVAATTTPTGLTAPATPVSISLAVA